MLNIIVIRPKVACFKAGKLQTIKPSSRVIVSLKANLDTYLNQSLSIGKVGIL
jgi:hypothetical protein